MLITKPDVPLPAAKEGPEHQMWYSGPRVCLKMLLLQDFLHLLLGDVNKIYQVTKCISSFTFSAAARPASAGRS